MCYFVSAKVLIDCVWRNKMYYTNALARELFTDNLLIRIHFIIAMIWWTGLAPLSLNSVLRGGERWIEAL